MVNKSGTGCAEGVYSVKGEEERIEEKGCILLDLDLDQFFFFFFSFFF